jgi:enoyl-CoA hydratase
MDYSVVPYFEVTVRDRVATATINRPDHLNACRREDHGQFGRLLRAFADDRDVDVAIVTGAGRGFSVGADVEYIDELLAAPSLLPNLQAEARELFQAHLELDKPVIAALNGPAMGSGLIFALLCDYIVADRQVRFTDGHVIAGLAAGDGGAVVWPLAIGLTRAKRYLLTSDWITATEAEKIGLITEVVDDGTCKQRAQEVAERFLRLPSLALRTTKQALNQWLRLGQTTAFDFSLSLEMQTFTLAANDIRAGVAAFRDRRTGGAS